MTGSFACGSALCSTPTRSVTHELRIGAGRSIVTNREYRTRTPTNSLANVDKLLTGAARQLMNEGGESDGSQGTAPVVLVLRQEGVGGRKARLRPEAVLPADGLHLRRVHC